MFGLIKRRRGLLVSVALVVLSLGIILVGDHGRSSAARVIGVLLSPVQRMVSAVGAGIGSAIDHYVFLVEKDEEVERLNNEVAKFKREILVLEEAALENERLKELLDFKESLKFDSLIAAKVMGRAASPWARTILLNKGEADGIFKDSAVVTPDGVVGRIYETTSKTSWALLITDSNSAIDALIQNTRAHVLVEGTLDPRCRVLYLARGEEVNPGDRIITSGMGGVFPKGLLLGFAVEIENSPGEVFQRLSLAPSADLLRLEEVLVIAKEQESLQP